MYTFLLCIAIRTTLCSSFSEFQLESRYKRIGISNRMHLIGDDKEFICDSVKIFNRIEIIFHMIIPFFRAMLQSTEDSTKLFLEAVKNGKM